MSLLVNTNDILVPVHTNQRADVCEDVLQHIYELEGIDIAQAELNI